MADGGLGRRRRGRRAACARVAGPRAGKARSRGRLRPRRPRVRRLDGPLPAHPGRPTGPRHVLSPLGKLASLQPRSCNRKRGVLPLDRTRLHPRPAPLPAPVRGPLGRPGGGRRRAARASARADRSGERPYAGAGGRALAAGHPERRRRLRRRSRPGVQPALQRLVRPRPRRGRPQPARRAAPRRPHARLLRQAQRGLGPGHRRDRAHGAPARGRRPVIRALRRPRPDRGHPRQAPRRRLDLRLRQLHRLRHPGPARRRASPREARRSRG